jgi:hypothetical protein
MDTIKPSTSPRKSPSRISNGARNIIWATLIAVELAISTAAPVALVWAGISKWGYATKVESGLRAPEKLIRHVQNLPTEFAETERLIQTFDKPWNIDKIRELVTTGRKVLGVVYEREKERIGDIMGGVENYRNMRDETLAALVTVLMIFLFLGQWVRLLRLWDRETLLDSFRRDIARSLGSHSRIESMTDTQIAEELERLTREQDRRSR